MTRTAGPRARAREGAGPVVYMLRCGDGTLYTGATVDLRARLALHRAGKASRYTRARLPVELVFSETAASWALALREEARIKRLPRSQKLALLRPSFRKATSGPPRRSPPAPS